MDAPLPSDPLPARAAVIGLITPVILTLLAMVISPNSYGGPGVLLVSTARFARTLIVEALLAATVGVWLWRQGWRPHRTATRPFQWRDMGRGLGLWLAALLGCAIWLLLCRAVVPEWTNAAVHVRRVGELAGAMVVPLSVINALFEELIWLGLGVAALQRFGVGRAAGISVGLRTLVHLYQGPLALIAILPLGLVFTAYYVRTRRLWPVVVAHACQDVLALTIISSGLMRGTPPV
jgi:membrane protease YdiL (CAAX protease family)